ncbi:MAG: right-handed parallel beta-helix repeat-containing protein [Candidatus Micrarchaeia archaeon]
MDASEINNIPLDNGEEEFQDNGQRKKKLLMLSVMIIGVIIIVAVFIFMKPISTHIPYTNNTITSNIPANKIANSTNINYLSACENITNPGVYTLSTNLRSLLTNTSCINIKANSVTLNCNNKTILGSGPYTDVPPFSYGINIIGQKNIVINNCKIANFSYNTYIDNSKNIKLYNDTLLYGYVANLYISNTSNSTFEKSNFVNSSSPYGSVIMVGSPNNKFDNNTLKDNTFIGFNVLSNKNSFINNYIVGSKESFLCAVASGFPSNNTAIGNNCYNNEGCDFISCSGTNIPNNASKIILQKAVNSCGSILYPGSYSLVTNLNMKNYSSFPISTLSKYNIPCINIKAPNVTLDCNNFTISNAYAGISINSNNTKISNCKIINSQDGIIIQKVSNAELNNIYLYNNNISFSLNNSNGDRMSHIYAYNGVYGARLINSYSNIFSNFTFINNTYGAYLSSSEGNLFNSGTALSNSKFDVFATLDSLGMSNNIMTNTRCSVTDAQWAPCTFHMSPTLASYPIDTCINITRPGTYNLSSDILNARSACFKINTNNVKLECSNFNITANPYTPGPAILINNKKNITISDCRIINFDSLINVSNSSNINLSNIIGINAHNYGIKMFNSYNSIISNTSIADTSNFTIYLDNVFNSKILNNIFDYAVNNNEGLVLNNSRNNLIVGNKGSLNKIGIALLGKSLNNTLYNNSFNNNVEDYVCSSNDSAINDGTSLANYGNNKFGCHWLIVEPSTVEPLTCFAASRPIFISLTHDLIYSTGTTCFGIYSNATTINCNGHTIEATNGGTLAKFAGDTKHSVLENCYIKGFTAPITMINDSSGEVFNNTIWVNTTQNSTAISAFRSTDIAIKNNSINTKYDGIYLSNITYGSVLNNTVNASTAFLLYNVTAMQISNNNATKSSGVGILMTNTIQTSFYGNNFFGITAGMLCINSKINTDMGNNYCTLNTGCSWITSSSSTCK